MKNLINIFAALLLSVSAFNYVSAESVSASEAVNRDRTDLAIGGYDPVTYFTQKKPAKGDFQVTSIHHGAVYRFVNKENKALFDRNPSKYLPAYGGYCAFGVALGKKFSADPEVYAVVDGKLYLNLNPKIAGLFGKDLKGNITKAEGHWSKIKLIRHDQIK